MNCSECHSVGVVVDGVCAVCGHGAQPIKRRAGRRPKTSTDAWREVQGQVTQLHERILKAIREAGGPLTDDDLEVRLNLSHQNVSARTNELRKAGRLIVSGVRKRTRHGRLASAWALAESGATTQQGALV